MGIFEAMMAPMIIFLVVVAPIWIVMHYKSKKHTVSALSAEEGETIEQLSRLAEKMEMRLSALEKILEAEDPKWKEKAL